MISIKLQGGLGNQMSQIFTTIAYFLKFKIPFRLPSFKRDLTSPYGEIYKRPLYFDNFLKKLKPFLISHNFADYHRYNEQGHHYTEIPKFDNNTILVGYFQPYNYFNEYKDDILKFIDFEKNKNNTKIKIKNSLENTISMHFRIGDYKHNPDAHPILNLEYYKLAIQDIIDKTNKNDYNIIYFYEKKDMEKIKTNIKILQRKFPKINFISCQDNLEDWEEMIYMSLCCHNIIANSTFSWWGAYLNNNKNKIVYYPSVWFGNCMTHLNIDDLFPKNWNKIII